MNELKLEIFRRVNSRLAPHKAITLKDINKLLPDAINSDGSDKVDEFILDQLVTVISDYFISKH